MTELQFQSIAWPEGLKTDTLMPIDVPAHIEKLIFLHDTVVLPSFGAFVAKRRQAQVDPEKGTLAPPTRTLAFDDAVLSNDGLLVADIARTHRIDMADAEEEVYAWVKDMEERLDRREIVTLPGIGRLYKNYIQRVQFIPDANNFNTETFGLPPIQFSPLGKSRQVSEDTWEAPAATMPAKASRRPWLGILSALLLLGLAASGVFMWWTRSHEPYTDIISLPNSIQKNTPGAQETALEQATNAQAPPAEGVAESKPRKPAAAQDVPAAKKPSKPIVNAAPPAKGKTCVLIVATLQDTENANRLKNQLVAAGYDLFTMEKNGHQVGVRFSYNDLSEVQQTIFDLQKLTGERDIWIKQK
ncbi:MAG: hypothetical protein SFV52_12650 [Saprospiraceae bacterium]|nr:hypothetical protein [Saprospiraceae bacterium]